MHNSNQIKVLFVPDWRVPNPYQKILMSALKQNGVDVVIDQYQLKWPVLFRTLSRHATSDIIHLHWLTPYVEWFTCSKSHFKSFVKLLLLFIDIFLVRLSGKKIVWTIHNRFMHEWNNLLIEKWVRKTLARYSDKVIVHCDSAFEEIKNEYGIKNPVSYSVIPHGHYIDAYQNTIDKTTARKMLGLMPDGVVFLSFGMIRSYKGIDRLLSTVKSSNKLKNVTFLIVGEPRPPEFEKEILEMASGMPNIKFFLEYIPDEKIQVYMNAADAAVFTFKDILTSGSVILAMSYGKAIIVPNRGCFKDLLDARGAIFFGDSNTLTAALEKAMVADLETMGAHNKERIAREDWNKIGFELKMLYAQILGRS